MRVGVETSTKSQLFRCFLCSIVKLKISFCLVSFFSFTACFMWCIKMMRAHSLCSWILLSRSCFMSFIEVFLYFAAIERVSGTVTPMKTSPSP